MKPRLKAQLAGIAVLALLLLTSMSPLAQTAMAGEGEGVEVNVNLGEDSYSLELYAKGYSENLTNVYLDSYLKATSDMIDGYIKAWATTENLTEFSASSKGYLDLEAANTSFSLTWMNELSASFTINSSMIDPSSPEKMLPTTLYLLIKAETQMDMETNETSASMKLALKPNVSQGLPYVLNAIGVPLPMATGDFALWLNVTLDTYTNMQDNITKGTIGVYIDFETGNLAADAQLATMIQMALSMYINQQMVESIIESMGVVNPTVNLDMNLMPGDASVFYIKIEYQGKIAPTNTSSIVGGQAPIEPGNITSIIQTPSFTPIEAEVRATVEWGLSIESTETGDGQYNVTIDGYIKGNYTGPETTLTKGQMEAWAKINNGNYEVYFKTESQYTSPVTGLLAAKEIGNVLFGILPEGTPVTFNFQTSGDVMVVDTSKTPPQEVKTITFEAGDLTGPFPLDNLGVIYGNTIIDTSGGVLTIVSDNLVQLDYDAAALVDAINAQAPGVMIHMGAKSTTLQDFIVTLDPNGDQAPEASANIRTGSIVGETLALEIMDRGEAEQLIDTNKYTVAGTPLKAQGLIQGEAEVTLQVDPGAGNVKVIKITDDGQVKVIENIVQTGSKIRFTTDSFSTFIPVVEKEAEETTTTQTTTTTTQETTTTTTTQETTTQTRETTTTTQETTTTTTETETGEETTTTASPTTTTTTQETTTTTQETTTQETTQETTTPTTTRTLTRPGATTTTQQETAQTSPTTTTQTQQEQKPQEEQKEQETTQQPQPAPEEQSPTQAEEEGGGINPVVLGVAALIIIVIAAVVLLRR
ncbi:MAG: hypothetical protein GSR84_06265 [Desulfurococcales archaeon]|nr:hypothetical protein [Desulfurococcales archaeon]